MTSQEKDSHAKVYDKPKKTKCLGTGGSVEHLEFESKLHQKIFMALHTPYFDYVMGAVIMVNFFLVIIETDKVAADEEVPWWIGASGWCVLVIFCIELVLRIFVLGRDFFRDGWCIFDFAVVAIDVVMSVLGLLFGSLFPVSALRVLRLSKLARVSKVFRVFPELREMMAGLVGSLRAIWWGSVLLVFALLIWGILAVQFLHPANKRIADRGFYEGCDRCPDAFSSVFEATLTFWQQIVAGDSWGQVTIPVIYEAPISIFFFGFIFISIGMAVLNLILGVVVNVATQAHDTLAAEIDDEKWVKRMEVHGHLLSICSEMDEDESGELTKEELFSGYKKNENFRKTLAEMDIAEDDLEILWTILDHDKSGSISSEEFVSHCYRMKLSDTQFMLAYIKYYITVIKDTICTDLAAMKHDIHDEQQKLEDEIIQVEENEKQVEKDIVQIEEDAREAISRIGELVTAEASNQRVLQESIRSISKESQRGVIGGAARPEGKVGDSKPTAPTAGLEVQASNVFDPQMYMSILEESRQQRADFVSGIQEIKNRLDLYLPVTLLEPKLNNAITGAQTPPPSNLLPVTKRMPEAPQARWPVTCCQGNTKPTVVPVQRDAEGDWSGDVGGSFTPAASRLHQQDRGDRGSRD
jgi:voltage-gated sodium channel